MSGTVTTTSTVNTVAPLITKDVGLYRKTSIYDPDNPPADASSPNRIVPVVESIVIDNNVLYSVESVDPNTYKSTLVPVILSDESDGYGLASIISYGNDIFRAYYDIRTKPYRLTVDRRLVIYGGAPSFYQLVRYPDTNNELVMSQYYSTTGVYTSNQIPMLPIDGETNTWWCQPCQIASIPADNEELSLRVYNETGARIAEVKLFAKQSDIVNDTLLYQPKIVDIKVSATQMLSDGSCYLYEKQSPDSLEITGTLVYSDGNTRDITVDQVQTFVYGKDDLLASYAGLQQKLLIKYFLSSNETTNVSANNAAVVVSDSSISREFIVKTVSNKLAAPIKISVIPEWNASLGVYNLRYFLYSSDHSGTVDVTSYVSITGGTFSGSDFVKYQTFVFSLNLNSVDSSKWATSTTYAQNCFIKLQPPTALERYVIADSASSPYIYGLDNSTSRRPILAYDSTKRQYFIPSSVFMTEESVLQSFYVNANPPYDTDIESSAAIPTDFLIRDAFSGAMLTTQTMSLSNYTEAFNLIGGDNGDFVSVTVIVEFIQKLSSGVSNILYGVPVDVTTGTYIGTTG